MDSSADISYLHNQIQHKNWVMIVKTVFLCDVQTVELEECLLLFPAKA